jgi:hypothetical protein
MLKVEITCDRDEVLSENEINLCKDKKCNDQGYIVEEVINEKTQSST